MRFDATATPETGPDSAAGSEERPTLIGELSAQNKLGAARQVWKAGVCAQVDPELFFPELGQPATAALAICASCPVRVTCLDVFGDLVPDGVIGGLSARERRARRATRRNGAAA
jgi:WhiB family redox-sensing transcriptional regulator